MVMTSRAWARTLPLLLPLVLVNTAAVYGQAGWAYDHLVHHWVIAALFAAAVESIGVYLAFEAHAALMAGDASARLRAGSYLIGLLAGVLNYAHFAGPAYRPTPLAVTFAALSSISPWLWAIRSRSMNRARLRELGQIDPRAVRFALLRWLLFPVRTIKAFRVAVWHGIVTPAEAVARSGVRAPGLPATRVDVPEPTPAHVPATPAAPVDFDVEPFMLAAMASTLPAIEAGTPAPTPENVPAAPKPARRRVWSDQQILAVLRDGADVPIRRDGTVAVGYVQEQFNCGQPRAVKLLKQAGMHRAGDPPNVPGDVDEDVPADRELEDANA
jgi:hypothetical protein